MAMTARRPITTFLRLAALVAAWPLGAQEVPGEALRGAFLPGWRTEQGTQMTALRLTMAPGWHTYWRAPGEAGIPPQFDWTGSDNVAAVVFHWPRPQVFELNGLRAIGYEGELVLPVEITPRVAGQPVSLMAEVTLGVCRDVCLPVSLQLSQDLPLHGARDATIAAALGRVPAVVAPAAIRCVVEPIRDGLRLQASVSIDALGRDEVAVVELRDGSIWVSEADSRRSGGTLTIGADLVPATGRPFALDRSGVTITLLAGDRAVELRGCPS